LGPAVSEIEQEDPFCVQLAVWTPE
jgi:hypothetical protein